MSFARRALAAMRPASLLLQHARPQQRATLRALHRRSHPTFTPLQRRFQSTYNNPAYAQQPPQPKRRSILFTTFKWLSFLLLAPATFSTLGLVAGYYFLPADTRAALATLWLPRASDADTLTFSPTDPATAAINTHIINHPLAQTLRRDPDLVESRPHLKIPAALRPTNLTAGALAGPDRISVPPLLFVERHGKRLVALMHLGPALCGHPGIVHGGCVATLLDEGLARCAFPALPNKMAVTAYLHIDYRKPALAGRYFVLRAETTRVEGRKAWVKGWIEELEDDVAVDEMVGGAVNESAAKGVESTRGSKAEGDKKEKKSPGRGKVVAECEALFVEPRDAARLKMIFGVD